MFTRNTHPAYRQPLGEVHAATIGAEGAAQAAAFFRHHHSYHSTPLLDRPALADDLGVGNIHVKDESSRLGLGSFKALGGMYAVARLVLEEASRLLERPVGVEELASPAVRVVAAGMVFACATDGNHGRSVAAGARLAGATAHIYVHEGVNAARRAAIERHGARVVTVRGSYDDAVAAAARACAEQGWTCVSDTAWPGYEAIPLLVMQGYTLLAQEALEQLSQPPTHVFIQAGVGGLAAALGAYMALRFGAERPRLVVVEPARAACLLSSMFAGAPTRIGYTAPTVMEMLECHTPSLVAWDILARVADGFLTVDEDDARAMAGSLAPVLDTSASGSAGMAGLARAAADPVLRAALGLDSQSRVLVINTEGADLSPNH